MNKSPIIKHAIFDKNHDWFRCPYCNEPIEYKEKKCRRCHEEISWDKEIIVYDTTGRRCCYHCRSVDGIKGISVDDNPEHSLLLCNKCMKELIEKLIAGEQE